jgi:predicted outer membrane repeat protein
MGRHSERNKPIGHFRGLERLEERRLLTITWANEFAIGVDDPNFDIYGTEEVHARSLVNRAIDDWEAILRDFNFDNDNNPQTSNFLDDDYTLDIFAGPLAGTSRGITDNIQFFGGRPFDARIRLDDNGGGTGWFFDQTPLDDAEFTGIANPFQASFIDASVDGQARVNDFYRTITHEIGHALGILLDGNLESPAARLYDIQMQFGQPVAVPIPENISPIVDDDTDTRLGQLQYVGIDQVESFRIVADPDGSLAGANPQFSGDELAREYELWQYTLADGTTITFTENGGGHFYEGPVDPNFTGAATHPNELMNPGRTVPASTPPALVETTRQFISDLDVRFLADAYGYEVTLPSDLLVDPDDHPLRAIHTSSMHTIFDSQTGTLLVQGLISANETFDIDVDGDEIEVTVSHGGDDYVSRFNLVDVTKVVIARNGGTDVVVVDPGLASLTQEVQYVVSSNEDNATAGTVGDGIVDLSGVILGNQVSLRAAIVDANGTAAAAARSIYVPRGHYQLTANATESANTNDLDITGNLTIIGTGAGLSVVDAGLLDNDGITSNDRVFEVAFGRSLSLTDLTVTGGHAGFGAGVYVSNTASFRADRVAFVDNAASEFGGALYVANGAATVSIMNSVFTGNSATTAGGAIRTDEEDVEFGGNVVALNTATTNPGNGNFHLGAVDADFNSFGNNLLISSSTGLVNGLYNDRVQSPASLFVVTSVEDAVDASTAIATALAASGFTTLRAAVQQANVTAGTQTIWLPAWRHRLTLVGPTPDTDAINDLDISSAVVITGVGPGMSIIDANALDDNNQGAVQADDRVISVRTSTGNLTLTGATITGGHSNYGGGIDVESNSSLTITGAAIAGNHASSMGGGLHVYFGSPTVTVTESVITGNHAVGTGGGVRSHRTGVVIRNTIIANNTDINGNAWDDVYRSAGSIDSDGNNLIGLTNDTGAFNQPGDLTGGTPERVVTSVADVSNRGISLNTLSLRNAIHLANGDAALDEVWLPAWNFVLTRERTNAGNAIEMEVSQGDLDIHESLSIRGVNGVNGQTWVRWRPDAAADRIFELLGDYDDNGISDGAVGSEDYTIWQDTLGSTLDLRADGDDNGTVQQADWQVWNDHFNHTFTRVGVMT